jgi:CubicO group peptidase (beta-lactamase class C family)
VKKTAAVLGTAFGLFAVCAAPAWGQASAVVGPTTTQVIVPKIDETMRKFVEAGEIAGAVTALATSESVLHLSSVGFTDLEEQIPMPIDAIFWIASMTKPVTGAAIAKLIEEGKLQVDDPVAKYLPEFAQLRLPEGAEGAGQPAAITVRHLLTHTAGLSELTAEESNSLTQLAELTELVATKPLKFAPGAKWVYSQTGINSAARIVEVLSGVSFPEYIQHTFFTPLQMHDTTFYLTDEQLPRLAKNYRRNAEGELEEAPLSILGGKSPTDTNRLPLANGGLFSTATDYTRFCQMLLAGGSLFGQQVLRPESVALIAQLHSGDLETGFTPGNGWGLGVCIVRQPQGVTRMLSPGSFGHGGAYGTQAWIDPARSRIYVLMVQRANFPNSDASPVREGFQAIAVEIEK